MTKNLRKTIVLVVLALIVLLVLIILLIFIPRLRATNTPPQGSVPTWEEIQELGVEVFEPKSYFVPNWIEVWPVHGATREQLEEVVTAINGVVLGRPSAVEGFIVQLPLCMAEGFTSDELESRWSELHIFAREFMAAHPDVVRSARTFSWSTHPIGTDVD